MRRWQQQNVLDLGDGRAKAKRLPPTLEADILGPLKKLLELHRNVAWAMRVNTGSGFLVDYNTMQAIIEALGGPQAFKRRFRNPPRWMEFGTPGASDFVGMLKDGRLLAVEAKAGLFRPSQVSIAQRSFLRVVNASGALGVVCNDSMRLNAILSGQSTPVEHKGGFLV